MLRVGLDGTDKEIDAGEYGAASARRRLPDPRPRGVRGGDRGGHGVDELKPGDYVVSIVRQAGDSIYDDIGTPDFTTDDSYHEHGINLVHGFLTESYVEDAGRLVLVPEACVTPACSSSPPPWS